jgi:hypothetical protein
MKTELLKGRKGAETTNTADSFLLVTTTTKSKRYSRSRNNLTNKIKKEQTTINAIHEPMMSLLDTH